MKLSLLMYSESLFCIWILVFPIGIIEVTTPRDWSFWLHNCSSHDSWPPSTWNSLEHKTWGEMEGCEKCAYQFLKMWKKIISWNIKTKCVEDIIWTVRSSSMEDYTSHYGLSTWKTNVYINFNKNNENLELFVYT